MNVCPLYFSRSRDAKEKRERERKINFLSFAAVPRFDITTCFGFSSFSKPSLPSLLLPLLCSLSEASEGVRCRRQHHRKYFRPCLTPRTRSCCFCSYRPVPLLCIASVPSRTTLLSSLLFSLSLCLPLSLSPSPSLSLAHALLSTTERHRIHSYARFPGVDYEREERRIISLLRTWSTGRSEKANTSIVLEKKSNSNHIDMVSQIAHRQTGGPSLFSVLVFLDQMSSARDSYFALLISFSRLISPSVIDCPSVFSCHGYPGLIKPGSMHGRLTSSSSSF